MTKPPVSHPFLWASVLGLLTGLLEVVAFAIDRFWFHRIVMIGPQVVWMAPSAALAIFLLFAVLVAALERGLRRHFEARSPLFLFSLLAALSLSLYYYPRLQLFAAILLSLGVATQASRLAAGRFSVSRRFLWRLGLAMVVIVLAGGAGLWLRDAGRVRRQLDQLGPAPSGAPNVILIVLDAVRAKDMSLYGFERRTTPELAAFAAQGATFDVAVAPAPWTAPSHASMFTGLRVADLSVGWRQPLADRFLTVAEAMRDRGYLTMGFVANTFGCTYERGLQQGFLEYRDHPVSWQEWLRSNALVRTAFDSYRLRQLAGNYQILSRKTAPDVNREFLEWVGPGRDRPFFAFLNYFDAHDPYLPPPPYDHMFGRRPRRNPWLVRMRSDKSSWSAEDLPVERDAYDGAIAYLDAQVGELLRTLSQRGILRNTLVIITSDHGEEFGEHGMPGHGHTLFIELLHVPLIMVMPGKVPAHTVVDVPVGLRDLAATVMDLSGLGKADGLGGRSLARFWLPSDGQAGEPVVADFDGSHALVSGRYHYIRGVRGRESLFDLEADGEEHHNLADTPAGRTLLPALRDAYSRASIKPDAASSRR